MKKLSNEEIKIIELDILIYIDKICKKNKLSYSICGGTMLGAVRHKGFIPWDDDIDIIMPRCDYNKLLLLLESEESNYKMLCCNNDRKYASLFAKIIDTRTQIIESVGNRLNAELGVYIDVFPYDGIGDNYSQAIKCYKKYRPAIEFLMIANWKKFIKSKNKKIFYEPIRYFIYLITRLVNPNKLACYIDRKLNNLSSETNYVACLCGSYRKREIFTKKIYDETTYFEFENRLFLGIKNYDLYLKKFYEEYNILPPKNKRISHHSFIAYK